MTYFTYKLPLAPRLLCCCILLVFVNALQAQLPAAFKDRYELTVYGQDAGMPQNSINSILPDNKGYLLVATEAGVVRFNGKGFTPCTSSRPVQANTDINGMETRIISLYYGNGDTILAFTAQRTILKIVNTSIVSVVPYNPGKPDLLFNYGKKVNYSGEAIKTSGWEFASGYYRGFPLNKDTFAVYLTNGYRIYKGSKTITDVVIKNFLPDNLFNINGYIIHLDALGNAAIYKNGSLVKQQALHLEKNASFRLCKGVAVGSYYLACDERLYAIQMDSGLTLQLQPVLSGLEKFTIRYVWQMNANNYVLSTVDNGLYVYSRNFFTTVLDTTPYANNSFYAQLLLNDNATVLTGVDRLFRNNRLAGISKTIRPDVFAILKDSRGRYWYGRDQKLQRATDQQKKAQQITAFKGGMKVIFEDKDKVIWVATTFQFGYIKDDIYTEVDISSLFNKRKDMIECIAQQSNGNLLLGTGSGILELEGRPGSGIKVSRFSGWEGQDVRYIKTETNGKVWVCTYGNGFYLRQENKVYKFPLDKQNKLAFVHCIIEDSAGYFWLPTNNGLFVTSKDVLQAYTTGTLINANEPFYYRFDKRKGFAGNEFNGGCQPAFIALPGGRYSLPSIKGLVNFAPSEVAFDFPNGNFSIEKVNQDTVNVPLQKRYDFPNNVHTITFTLASPFWGDNDNNVLQYSISPESAGKDAGYWLDVNASMSIVLSGLKHDDYRLQIRQRTGFKDSDFVYQTIYFSICANWYQSKWFYGAGFVLALLLLLLFFRLRTQFLKRRNLVLQHKINEATIQLTHTNSSLEKNIQIRNRLISIFTHDISAPLQYISIALGKLQKRDELNNENKRQVSDIFYASRQLSIMANDFIQWIKIQQTDVTFNPEMYSFNLKDLLIEKWDILKSVADEKGIVLKIDNEAAMNREIITDRKILGVIFYNLFSNAIKFTKVGFVIIDISTQEKNIVVSIKDTGRGFSPDQLQRINSLLDINPQYGTDNEIGKGMGLKIIRDLGEIIGVRILIHSQPEAGALVKVFIPATV